MTRTRLYCLPYAGGSAARIYAGWQGRLPGDVEVVPLELPGRGTRIRERPVPLADVVVADVLRRILPRLDETFALFGHSLGALLAVEVARVLERDHGRTATRVMVSGAAVPGARGLSGNDFLLPEPQFRERIRQLAGTPRPVLENDELMALFVPVLRADFAVAAQLRRRTGPPLSCPITVFGGESDVEVAAADLAGWQGQTTSSCRVHRLPGGHFFVDEVPELLLPVVADELVDATGSAGGGPGPGTSCPVHRHGSVGPVGGPRPAVSRDPARGHA